MKKLILTAIIAVSLSGCASIKTLIPSFWDDNQSASIINVRQKIENISCEPNTQYADSTKILAEVEWFELYSQSKGFRQQDVIKIIKPMKETLDDWQKRSKEKEGSKIYCEGKKKVLQKQSSRAAEAILGRF